MEVIWGIGVLIFFISFKLNTLLFSSRKKPPPPKKAKKSDVVSEQTDSEENNTKSFLGRPSAVSNEIPETQDVTDKDASNEAKNHVEKQAAAELNESMVEHVTAIPETQDVVTDKDASNEANNLVEKQAAAELKESMVERVISVEKPLFHTPNTCSDQAISELVNKSPKPLAVTKPTQNRFFTKPKKAKKSDVASKQMDAEVNNTKSLLRRPSAVTAIPETQDVVNDKDASNEVKNYVEKQAASKLKESMDEHVISVEKPLFHTPNGRSVQANKSPKALAVTKPMQNRFFKTYEKSKGPVKSFVRPASSNAGDDKHKKFDIFDPVRYAIF